MASPLDPFLSTLGRAGQTIGRYVRPTLSDLGLIQPPIASPLTGPRGIASPIPDTGNIVSRQFAQGTPPGLQNSLAQAVRPGISSLLLSALARQENQDFATNQVNPESGAAGLFQFNPITLEELSRQGFNQGQQIDPFNADQSAAAAAFYLDLLLKRFGNLPDALAAYNAGPGNVEKYGGIPPFPETQNYVQNITNALSGIGGE